MNDLFEAIKTSIKQYIEVDTLPPRRQKVVKGAYEKYAYNMDTVDSLFNFNKEEPDADK